VPPSREGPEKISPIFEDQKRQANIVVDAECETSVAFRTWCRLDRRRRSRSPRKRGKRRSGLTDYAASASRRLISRTPAAPRAKMPMMVAYVAGSGTTAMPWGSFNPEISDAFTSAPVAAL
jgi:hypothetical protein